MKEDVKVELKELKAMVADIHKLHFSGRQMLSKDSLKERMKAEILIKPVRRHN